VKNRLLDLAKKWLFDFAIKRLLGGVAVGWQWFILKTGLEQLWKHVIGPRIAGIIRWFQKKYRERKYRKIGKKAVEAKDENTRRKHIDDLLD